MEAQPPRPPLRPPHPCPRVSPGLGTHPLAGTEPWFLCLWRITGWMRENADEMTSVKAFSQCSANGTFPAERTGLRVTCGRAPARSRGPGRKCPPPSWLSEQTCGCKNKECVSRPEAIPWQGSWHLPVQLGPLPTFTFSEESVLSGLYHSFKQHLLSPYYVPGTAPCVHETDGSSVLRDPTFKGVGVRQNVRSQENAALR